MVLVVDVTPLNNAMTVGMIYKMIAATSTLKTHQHAGSIWPGSVRNRSGHYPKQVGAL